jgi:hypothetical protein
MCRQVPQVSAHHVRGDTRGAAGAAGRAPHPGGVAGVDLAERLGVGLRVADRRRARRQHRGEHGADDDARQRARGQGAAGLRVVQLEDPHRGGVACGRGQEGMPLRKSPTPLGAPPARARCGPNPIGSLACRPRAAPAAAVQRGAAPRQRARAITPRADRSCERAAAASPAPAPPSNRSDAWPRSPGALPVKQRATGVATWPAPVLVPPAYSAAPTWALGGAAGVGLGV